MTHTRVSPDLKWVVFTTYNNPGADGFAKEDNNYANAEICLFKLGGTEVKTIAGPMPGEVNAADALPGGVVVSPPATGVLAVSVFSAAFSPAARPLNPTSLRYSLLSFNFSHLTFRRLSA